MREPDSLELDFNELDSTVEVKNKNSKMKKIILLIGISIILIVIISVIIYFLVSQDDEPNPVIYDYSIMMDAGSTSTRTYTYSYPKRKDHSLLQIEEKSYFKKSAPINGATEFSSYFKEIFEDTKKQLNNISNSKANYSNVPVFLKATAGVRKLDNSTQEKIISGIQKVFKEESPFLFEDNWAKVISGIEEAYFGWVTVNYITGTLKKNDKARKQLEKTQGSLDMGGSSIEIAFAPQGEIKENKVNINLGHLSYDLYSNVIEHFGQDESIQKLNDYVVSESTSKDPEQKIIQNPCYLRGYSEEYEKDPSINITGIGNAEQCEEYIKKYFIPAIQEKYTYFPEVNDINFVALSGFAFAADCIGVSNTEYISPDEFLAKGKEYCLKTINEAQEYRPEEEVSYLKDYCFMSIFDYHLFVDVFKFKHDEKKILFTKKINGYTPSWALGAMTYEVGLLPFK